MSVNDEFGEENCFLGKLSKLVTCGVKWEFFEILGSGVRFPKVLSESQRIMSEKLSTVRRDQVLINYSN